MTVTHGHLFAARNYLCGGYSQRPPSVLSRKVPWSWLV